VAAGSRRIGEQPSARAVASSAICCALRRVSGNALCSKMTYFQTTRIR
jgi:hypothetical protein